MKPARARYLIQQANYATRVSGDSNADVSVIIEGGWPKKGYKRLDQPRGPFGWAIEEYENGEGVLCLFKAHEIRKYCEGLI